MTEAEWLACNDSVAMLRFVESRTSNRKLRLLGCACVRTAWAHVRDSRSRAAYQAAQGKRTWAAWAAVSTLTNHFLEGWRCASGLIRCRLLQDLLGPTCYRAVSVLPDWLLWDQAVVLNLAQTIYNDRDFDRLGILADALEDAGCTNADILSHLREPDPHVRGCWALDLILGLE